LFSRLQQNKNSNTTHTKLIITVSTLPHNRIPGCSIVRNHLLLSEPKPKTIVLKVGTPEETRMKGYTFRFELEGQPELLRLGYEGGFSDNKCKRVRGQDGSGSCP